MAEPEVNELSHDLDLGETINESPLNITTDDVVAEDQGNLDETRSENEVLEGADEFKKPIIQGSYVLQKVDVPSELFDRFVTGDLLGSGSGGDVFDLQDNNLGRTVAVKFLSPKFAKSPKNILKFMREALITSRLDHPSILPVYDLETSADGQLYFTMKKVTGIPLSMLAQKTDGNESEAELIREYHSIGGIVNIFVKVAEALAYAHAQEIIHRDIKPDNIMLGHYGEVRVVDWGVAAEKSELDKLKGKMTGTPFYMSPEQAVRGDIDERSDIYGIGCTLFHVLTKRPVLMTNDVEEFWTRKRAGEIDILTEEERAHIPAPLMAICYKCLEANPKNRYQTVAQLLEDLRNYQNGALINAYHYNAFEFLKIWIRNNKQNMAWLSLLLLVALIAATVIYRQSLREFGDWGDPIYAEDFDEIAIDDWKESWIEFIGTFELEAQKLVTKGRSNGFKAFYNERIEGAVRFEFVGSMLKDSFPGDLTIAYCPDVNDIDHIGRPKNAYYLQLGGQSNECAAIVGPGGRLDFKPLKLENEKDYHIRGDIDGKSLRLFLDGELVCSHELQFPLNSGYIGIYGFYEGKSFDNVRIYKRELPEVVNIIKTADILYHNGVYDAALRRYEEIARIYEGTDIGEESLFKQGLCLYDLDRADEAFAVWADVNHVAYTFEVLFYRLNEMYKQGSYDKLLAEMHAAYAGADMRMQKRMQLKWAYFLSKANYVGDIKLIRPLLEFRELYFHSDQFFATQTFQGLYFLGETRKAMSMFPTQSVLMAKSLLYRGHYDEVFERYAKHRFVYGEALLYAAKYDELIEQEPNNESVVQAWYAKGDFSKQWDGEEFVALGLFEQGAYRQVIDDYAHLTQIVTRAHLALGTFTQYAMDNLVDDPVESWNIEKKMAVAIERYVSGDKSALAELKELRASLNGFSLQATEKLFSSYFLDAVWEAFEGDKTALSQRARGIWEEKKEMQGMRLWHCAGLLLGRVSDEVFLAQPMQHYLRRDYLLFKALHYDLYGDKTKALPLYEQLAALPSHLGFHEYFIGKLVEDRIAILQRIQLKIDGN